MGSLDGKVALVTGAARGIGRETARVLAERGARVVVNDLDRIGMAEDLARQLGASCAVAVKADVTDSAQVKGLVEDAVAAFGRIDILVNNAGGSLGTARFLEEVSDGDWRRVIELTLTSQFFAARAVAPRMKAQRWGRIVNVSSVAGVYGDAALWSPAYAAAKAGVCGFTRHPGTVHQQSRILRLDGRQRDLYGRRLTDFWATVEVGGNDLNGSPDIGHHFFDRRVLVPNKYDLRVTMVQRIRQLRPARAHVKRHRYKAPVHRS